MNEQITGADPKLTKRIMRRIYLVWSIRMLLSPVVLKSLIALLLLQRSTAYISYERVLANRPRIADIPANLAFVQDAFMHTEVASVLLIMGMLAIMAWLAMDILGKRQHSYF